MSQSPAAARRPRPVVLCVLDGWGERQEHADNAILLAKTPHWTALERDNPHALLATSAWPWVCRKARWAIPRSAT